MKKVILSLFVITGIATCYATEDAKKEPGVSTVAAGASGGSGTGVIEAEKSAPVAASTSAAAAPGNASEAGEKPKESVQGGANGKKSCTIL
jgi:hypothetical protein